MMRNMRVLGVSAAWALVLWTAAAAHGQLVINEVDYDQVGTDTTEFVEVRNNSTCRIDLTNLALVFINGANNVEYRRVALVTAGYYIQPGQYLVLKDVAVSVPTGVLTIDFTGPSDNIQNGAPDGIAIIDTSLLTVLDSISYEGAMTAAQITGFPSVVSLVSGTPIPTSLADSNAVPGSFVRFPDGRDTNNDIDDWAFVSTPTPGAGNGGASQPLISCCGSADFNGDGDLGTDSDIEAFFACLAGACCASCSSADFNGDGDLGTDADIEAFFRVLAGGSC